MRRLSNSTRITQIQSRKKQEWKDQLSENQQSKSLKTMLMNKTKINHPRAEKKTSNRTNRKTTLQMKMSNPSQFWDKILYL